MIKNLVAGDEVDAIKARLESIRSEGAVATAELERLEAINLDAASYEESRKLEQNIEKQKWLIDRALKKIPELKADLETALSKQREQLFERSVAELGAIYRRLRVALEEAARIQEEAIKAHEASVAAFNSRHFDLRQPQLQLPRVVFFGFLTRQHLGIWTQEMDRTFDAKTKLPAAPKKVASPPRPQSRPDSRNAMTPRAVSLNEQPARTLTRAPNPDDMTPLSAGQVRVRVLRAGYAPTDDSPQCDRGQVVRMNREAAERAAIAGAVEIIEEKSAQ